MTKPPKNILSPAEVAELFGVTPTQVSRWADEGKLPSQRTLGGHRRFRREDVDALLARVDAGSAA